MTDEELKQLVESNARTIQAMLEQQATDRLRHEQRMDELQNAMLQMTSIQNGLARILGSLDPDPPADSGGRNAGLREDRPIILRRLMSIENKIDRLLDDRN